MSSSTVTSSSSSSAVSDSVAETVTKKISSRFLGNSGVLVSEFCLGAMTLQISGKGGPFGMPGTVDEHTSHAILNRYVQLGGNFIDTADVWNESEQCIGDWLASKSDIAGFRDNLVLSSKVHVRTGPGMNDVGLSRKHILANFERSLKHLQTSYIDLYQVHAWDPRTDISDVLRTLNDLVRSGKVRNIGFCNFHSWQAQKAMDFAKSMGLEPFISNQSQYSLLCRSTEWDVLPQCQDSSLAFLPWSPLSGGWLTGKYRRGSNTPLTGSRIDWGEKFGMLPAFKFKQFNDKDQTHDIIDELMKISEDIKATPTQVALRWVAQKPGVTSVIIGAKTLKQLEENLQAAFIRLTDEQMARLDKVSEIPMLYPWGSAVSRMR